MMRWIIKTSLRFRFVVVAVAVALMVFGIGALRKMPVDVFPEFAPPRVQIQTACLGLTATEVEGLVTTPMEQAFAGIPGLDFIRSKSAPQLSALELVFKLGTDEIAARQLVQERMATVQNTLPTWAAPPVMLQPLSATSRIDEDRADLGHDVARGPVDDRLLEDPRSPAAGARAWPTSRCGVSASRPTRWRPSRRSSPRRASPSTTSWRSPPRRWMPAC